MQSYKELKVYKEAYMQVKRVYEIAKKLPSEERYELSSQIRRASVSIPLNIAEGYGKVETGKELIRYLSIARGSSAEMEVLLDLIYDFGYVNESEYAEMKERQERVGKMLTGLIRSITSKS